LYILSLAQSQVLELRDAFLPTTIQGSQSPDISDKGHLSDEEDNSVPLFQEPKEL